MKNGLKRSRNATGSIIRKLRNAKGWSQRVLARELNLRGLHYVDTTLIGKIEAGIRRCYDYEVFFIAEILDVGIDELFPKPDEVLEVAQNDHDSE